MMVVRLYLRSSDEPMSASKMVTGTWPVDTCAEALRRAVELEHALAAAGLQEYTLVSVVPEEKAADG